MNNQNFSHTDPVSPSIGESELSPKQALPETENKQTGF